MTLIQWIGIIFALLFSPIVLIPTSFIVIGFAKIMINILKLVIYSWMFIGELIGIPFCKRYCDKHNIKSPDTF